MGSTQVIAKKLVDGKKKKGKKKKNKDQANTGSYMATFPGEC